MAVQYSYVMKGLTKTFPGAAKPVLNNIHLQFLPDAKIAIIGPNGSGKSTLMKIMGGIDPDFVGEAWAAEGIKVGYLPQEPQLDPSKDVMDNVKDGVRPIADLVDRFNAISAEMGDPKDDTDFDKLLEEMGDAAGADRRGRWLEPRQPAGDRDGGAALPAGRRATSPTSRAARSAVWRCASCCSKSPTSCCSTSRPTISTPKASSGWRIICSEYTGNVILVTHDRYFLDNVVNWVLELDRGRYYTYESNYSGYLEKKVKRLEQEEREEAGQGQGDRRRARLDAPDPQGAPDQVQGAYPRVR